MARTQTQDKKRISLRAILLILFVAIVVTFGVMNRAPVYVWPLGPDKPLILVIGISFVLGALVGWLMRSITHRRVFLEREIR
jgi:uncharacterized integral membrane protein